MGTVRHAAGQAARQTCRQPATDRICHHAVTFIMGSAPGRAAPNTRVLFQGRNVDLRRGVFVKLTK
jgi:hypothetical protein